MLTLNELHVKIAEYQALVSNNPNFNTQFKDDFLRLHTLISDCVTPGSESKQLIDLNETDKANLAFILKRMIHALTTLSQTLSASDVESLGTLRSGEASAQAGLEKKKHDLIAELQDYLVSVRKEIRPPDLVNTRDVLNTIHRPQVDQTRDVAARARNKPEETLVLKALDVLQAKFNEPAFSASLELRRRDRVVEGIKSKFFSSDPETRALRGMAKIKAKLSKHDKVSDPSKRIKLLKKVQDIAEAYMRSESKHQTGYSKADNILKANGNQNQYQRGIANTYMLAYDLLSGKYSEKSLEDIIASYKELDMPKNNHKNKEMNGSGHLSPKPRR